MGRVTCFPLSILLEFCIKLLQPSSLENTGQILGCLFLLTPVGVVWDEGKCLLNLLR
jgi:hypothetical protein